MKETKRGFSPIDNINARRISFKEPRTTTASAVLTNKAILIENKPVVEDPDGNLKTPAMLRNQSDAIHNGDVDFEKDLNMIVD